MFASARQEALRLAKKGVPAEPEELRRLDHRMRRALALLPKAARITSSAVAQILGLSDRMARVLLKERVAEGWLQVANASDRAREYDLPAIYRQYIGGLSAMPGQGESP